MANKYVIHGETYDGDGTSSSPATSDGGVGAWNNLETLMQGTVTYGSIDAGDVVNVRSKDASGNDITISLTAAATLGNSNGTTDSPVTWHIDNGNVWSGVSGTVTFEHGDNTVTVLTGNSIIGHSFNFAIVTNVTSRGSSVVVNIQKYCILSEILIDNSSVTSGYAGYFQIGGDGNSVVIGCKFKMSYRYQKFLAGGQYSTIFMIGCILELTESDETDPVFTVGNYSGTIYLIGGQLFGAGATESVNIVNLTGTGGNVYLNGFKYPRVMGEYLNYYKMLWGIGVDGKFGAKYSTQWYSADSRADGYYPTLNAVLPTSNSKSWSYRMYNFGCSILKPSRLTISKLFMDSPATKTITLEWLSNDEMPVPNSLNSYMTVTYIQDSDGEPVTINTLDENQSEIAESTAGWSAKTYGPSSFTARKFSITTPTAIKQHTQIIISGFWGFQALNTSQIFFVDPDPVIG